MAIRDWFRINWRSWKFWLVILVAEYILSILVGSRSLVGSIFYYIFAGFGYGLGFVPNFIWWIFGLILWIFLFFKFRRLLGKIIGGTGTVMQYIPFLGWAGKILSLVGSVIGYGKSAQWQKLRKRYKGIRGAYILNVVADTTKVIFTKIPKFKTHFWKLRNMPDREREIVFRNRLLFMRLLDQELRFDIFTVKFIVMKKAVGILQNRTRATGKFVDQAELKNLIMLLRSQKGKIRFGTDIIGEDPVFVTRFSEYADFIGWNYLNNMTIYYMNHLIRFFEAKTREGMELATRVAHITDPNERAKELAKLREAFNMELRKIAYEKVSQEIEKISTMLGTSRGQYNLRIKNYLPHYTIKAYTLYMWDMYNSSGEIFKPYRFAKVGARYRDETGAIRVVSDNDIEVNVYGEFMEDVSIEGVRAGRWPRRRLINPKRDSRPFPSGLDMGGIAELYERDWSGFIRDFRFGIYHPYTRSVAEYIEAWDKGIWKDDDIKWLPRGAATSLAFDLRVLANPGMYTWWGREKYTSPETEVPKENKEPHISEAGIKQFIDRLIERTDAQIKETERFLYQLYPFDVDQKVPETLEEWKGGKFTVGRYKYKKQ